MSGPGSFNHFSSLAGMRNQLVNDEEAKQKAKKASEEAKAKKAQNAYFEKALKGKFEDFPPASYESKLKDVRSITIVQPQKGDFLPILVSYLKKDKINLGRASFQILSNGVLSGEKIPEELSHLTKQNIVDEVARIAETIGVGMWHKLDLDILPDSDSLDDEFGRLGSDEVGRPQDYSEKVKIDPERLRFLSKQPGFLFGAMSKEWGFDSKGYMIGVFSKCFVFENNQIGNAAFIVPFGEEIKPDEEISKRAYKGKIMNKPDAQALANIHLKPALSVARTRRQLVDNLNAIRVVHAGNVWQDKMADIITEIQNTNIPEN